MQNIILIYHSNNSGGYWWLEDADWHALAEAGWNVHWSGADPEIVYGNRPLEGVEFKGLRDLGALARSAACVFSSVQEGLDNFQAITERDPSELGCSCCGVPHEFEWRTADGSEHGYIDVIRPATGDLSW